MNLILLEEKDFITPQQVKLRGRRAAHIRAVHRAQTGDSLRIGLLGGLCGVGQVTSIQEDSITLDVLLNSAPPEPLPLTLCLALPRPKFLKRILISAATLGIKDIYLFHSYRVEKAYWSCAQIEDASLRETLILGLEQARDTILPRVHLKRLFKPFVEDEAPALFRDRLALVAHPGAEELCPFQAREPVTLVIGPEGGFIQYELDKLSEAGARLVRTYPRILKVETALASVVGRLV